MYQNVSIYIDSLILREGEYSNRPSDRGGPTRWGITERVARQNGYLGDMRDLPQVNARQIYLKEYWLKPNFSLIEPVSVPISLELLDTGVNMHPSVASKFLQRVLNAFNKQGTHYPDLKVDGMLGGKTVEALQSLLKRRGNLGEVAVVRALNCLQGELYITIAENDPAQEDFAVGWMLNRVS